MQQTTRLFRLSETDYAVADPADDVRGFDVIDRDADKVGSVDDLLIDEEEKRVRFLRISSGGFLGIGQSTILVPVEAVASIDERNVRLDETRERVRAAPVYDPDVVHDDTHYTDVYGYWGYPPYWTANAGYVAPGYPIDR